MTAWLSRWRARWAVQASPVAPTDRERAQALIRALDAGGVPLNPARVNAIARSLGLEVSRHAAMAHTVERIRAALKRLPD